MSFDNSAIDRNLFTRTHTHSVADSDRGERGILLGSVPGDPVRSLGCQAQELADCSARAAARPELEPLTEEHQRDDGGGDLEIHRHHAVLVSHISRKKVRRQGGYNAVGECHDHAKANERVHIG